MSKMFVNNVGKVLVYDRAEAMPASVKVNIRGSGNDTVKEDLDSVISVFVTKMTNTRNTQVDIRRNLKRDFFLIPFGESPGTVAVNGVVFSAAQFSIDDKSISADDKYDRLMKDAPYANLDEQGALQSMGLSIKKHEPESGSGSWVTGLQDKLDGVTSGIKDSAIMGGLKSAVGAANSALETAKGAIDTIMSAPGAIIGSIKSSLGLAPSGEPLITELSTDDKTPLSYQQLHRVFDLLQAGSAKSMINRPILSVSVGGVVFRGALMSMNSSTMENGMGFEFSMNLMVLSNVEYTHDDYVDPVSTRAEYGLLNQVGGALLEAGLSAARPRIPTGIL